MRDAGQRREPREYAQKILGASKDTGFTTTKNQLDVIYTGIDHELRRDIRRPKERTTSSGFLEDIEDLKNDWWTFGSRHSSRFQSQGAGNTQGFRQARLTICALTMSLEVVSINLNIRISLVHNNSRDHRLQGLGNISNPGNSQVKMFRILANQICRIFQTFSIVETS